MVLDYSGGERWRSCVVPSGSCFFPYCAVRLFSSKLIDFGHLVAASLPTGPPCSLVLLAAGGFCLCPVLDIFFTMALTPILLLREAFHPLYRISHEAQN